MVARWQKMASPQGPCEVDIWPELQKLTADVISRAAFGSNYEEGKHIFELQKEMITLVLESMQTIYIPGFRYYWYHYNISNSDMCLLRRR
jgi:cytochrome P450